MNLLSKEELTTLAEKQPGPCVSIYIPTHRKGKETIREDPIHLKNQLAVTSERLAASGLRTPEIKALLKPAHELLRERPFWEHQSDGLALFLAPDFFRSYSLPLNFDELAVVSDDRFYLKPLLPLFTGDGLFYILGLSQNAIRLFQGTRFSIDELELEKLPKSLAEALREEDPEKQLQFHTGTDEGLSQASTLRVATGERPAIFHGHSPAEEPQDEELILRYFRHVDQAVADFLRNEEVPLILAGVEYLFPIYQKANNYPFLMAGGVTGNPEELRMRVAEIHQEAWKIVQPHFEHGQQAAAATYEDLAHTERASSDLAQIAPAAYYGAIDVLFVASGFQQWGRFDLEDNVIELHDESRPDNRDLIEDTAIQTFLNSGTVYVAEAENVPGGGPLAAIFRYEPVAGATIVARNFAPSEEQSS